jgi:hypothetical protein
MSEQKPERRICIMGTAPTWKDIPWDDPTLEIWGLNDAWLLNLPRVDRWFDVHPLDKLYFRDPSQKKIKQHEVPAGFFLRPKGHIEWLRQQTIPVYLQQARADIPASRTFPKAEIEAKFGRNFASSPAWMIGLALLEGVTELHIYGIHLATEWEYLKQKPNMTFLLGLAAGLGVKVHLPKGCPLIAETHQYAYEPDPGVAKTQAQRRVDALMHQKAVTLQQAKRKWWQFADPNLSSRVSWLDAQILDAQLGLQHVVAGRTPAGL